MRREVPALLMNEKVTYKVFQGDHWVTLTLGFSYSKVAFGLSFSQSDPWNFSSRLITINRKIWRLFIFLIFYFKKMKYYLPYFTNYFTIIIQFYSPLFQKCFLHASWCDKIFSSLELKMWDFFTSRAMLHFLYSSMLITNFCTKVV